jgi:ribosomal-protein-alanine N-acetyltransferase
MDEPFRIRPALRDDLAALARLEVECFSDPWSETSLAEVLAAPGGPKLVAETQGVPVGYLLTRVVAGQAEILTFGVVPGERRRGAGRRLLEAALAQLRRSGVGTVWLEVRASNAPAQALYRSLGFRPGGIRRAYYRYPTEDALVFRLALAPDPA